MAASADTALWETRIRSDRMIFAISGAFAIIFSMSSAKITCHDLIQTLRKAYDENRLESRLKHFAKYKLLIIDEIGYLPVDKTGANLLFQLIAKRYEHNSTIITTNQPFSKWGDVFSDSMLANAILDRLLHHSHVVKMVGPSYRTKDYYDLLDSGEQNQSR